MRARTSAGLKETVIIGNFRNDIGHYHRLGTDVYADVTTLVGLIRAANPATAIGLKTMYPRRNFLNTSGPNQENGRLSYNTLGSSGRSVADCRPFPQ